MSERALKTAPEDVHVSDPDDVLPESPGSRLLDALRAGDDTALLAAVSQSTTVTAENMPWSCRGPDEVATMLREAREHFPGLTFEPSTRHVGFGIVIEEARVRDSAPQAAQNGDQGEGGAHTNPSGTEGPAAGPASPGSDIASHPMWDAPTAPTHRAVSVWREPAQTDGPPAPLNMPIRLTVKHDDLQVHEVTLSFPAALLKRALGMRVDPLEVSLSEVQSAFIAPVGAGFTTHRLARPELALAAPPAVEEPTTPVTTDEEPPRRRRRILVPLLLAMVAGAAGAGWWVIQGSKAADVASPPVTSTTPQATPTPTPTTSPTPSASASPSVEPSAAVRSRKPNVTLKSDLAFGFDSALLSPAAKHAIARVAHQVRHTHLVGTIYVDGYTDNIGSAAYGKVLSQERADAVAGYLRRHLGNARVTVVPVGHGEAHPIASNATTSGQEQNRRVTITLPRP
jgi:outer membrane protein OmpA-like peptidoglycan-associated protein